MDVRAQLQKAKSNFRALGVSEVDAEHLFAHILGISRMDLHNSIKVDRALSEFEDLADVEENFSALCRRRENGEPLQYITGIAYFYNLTLEVGPGVLVPRPETEQLVESILTHLKSSEKPTSVIDLGAGSGAIALAIATQVPTAHVIAVENDADALVWLRKNCESADAEVRIVAEDVATALLGVKADLVVANPPYIPNSQKLPNDVLIHEPHAALFGGGGDGMETPRIFIDAAARLLKPGGLFVMEHGEEQAVAVDAKLSEDFIEIKNHMDLNQRPRWSSAVRKTHD
ncbi:MAG: peptide chain release factor N(5)-glutamine methyltransferase [Candidatus Nanopelagicaceae bacterium]|nr:peptide chain release factor N(5)-glutamine methyltransferase [Candidatus Nanopelagicaceae bacterium]